MSGAAPRAANSLSGDAAFRFEADIDEGGIVLDRDDPPLDDGAFETVGDAKRFIEQRGETLFRAEFGGFYCDGHSFSSIPGVTSGPAGIDAEQAAGGERARPHRPGPADRKAAAPTASARTTGCGRQGRAR